MTRSTWITIGLLGFSLSAVAAPTTVSYQGRITRADGTPVTGPVDFRIQILSPNAENCLMFEEERTVTITSPQGAFSININDGGGLRQDSGLYQFEELFSNRTFTYPSGCTTPGTFTLDPNANRKFVVSFDAGSGWETLPTMETAFAPQAIESMRIAGYGSGDLLRVDKLSSQTVNALTYTDYEKLVDLLAGKLNRNTLPTMTVGQVLGSNGSGGWTAVTPLTSADVPNCASGSFLRGVSGALQCDPAPTGGGGSGSVTSVGVTVPTFMSSTGGPVTTSGDIALSFNAQAANLVFAGPTTGSAAPAFRTLNIADIKSTNTGNFFAASGACAAGESLSYSSVSDQITCEPYTLTSSQVTTALTYTPVNRAGDTMTGALNLPSNGLAVGTNQLVVSGAQVGIGTATPTATLEVAGQIKITGGSPGANKVLTSNAAGLATWETPAAGGGGGLTSVGLTLPTELTVTGSPLTANGSISAAWASQTQGQVFASPTGATGAPVFRAIASTDLPSLSSGMTGTLPVANGGTGAATLTSGSLLVGNGTTAITGLAGGSAGNILYAPTATSWASVAPDTAGVVAKSGAQTIAGVKTFSAQPVFSSGIQIPTGASANRVLTSDASGNATWQDPAAAGLSGTVNTVPYYNTTSTLASSPISISSSFVGIGTASPSASLHVNGIGLFGNYNHGLGDLRVGRNDAGAMFSIQSTGAANRSATMHLSGTDSSNNAMSLEIRNNAATSTLQVLSSSAHDLQLGTNSTGNVTIQNGGNVGVGTNNPTARFEVAGQIKITGGAPGAGKVLTSDAAGLATWETLATGGGGSLTNFTEAVNTAAPNATVPAVSLTATNAAANVDVVFMPKGTGAILGQVPDGTVAGGAKRGQKAVDLQTIRSSLIEVASGDYSVIGGGERNSAFGNRSVVSGGYQNIAQTLYGAVGGGISNNASGQSATISGGASNVASGMQSAVAGGSTNNATGTNSFAAGGANNTASGSYSLTGGFNTSAPAYSQVTFGAYNLAKGSETAGSWVTTDPLFVIGNGTGSGSRSTAFMVLKDGSVGIGTTSPTTKLEVAGQIKITGGTPGANKVLTSDAAGLATWQTPASGSSLTNFVEAVTTASPNATVPAVSLTATNAATNVDLVLRTKGQGALLASVPDGMTGGAKRGVYAVDWQILKASAASVAAGARSVISGGSYNRAGGADSAVAGGEQNIATGSYSTVAGGYSNNATGNYSLAAGNTTTADASTQTTFGAFNRPKGSESATTWVATDPLFVIGNGTGSGASRSTAFMVLKDGSIGIGTTSPTAKLEVTGQVKITGGTPGAGKVLTSDASGLATWETPAAGGGGSLTNFTEAVNTAAPNATIPVVSLSATNAATNVDVAITPKGTGAISADRPDGTWAGGDKRGSNAVDFQTERVLSTSVASGAFAVIGGGQDNTASGQESTVSGGLQNRALDLRTVVAGGEGNAVNMPYGTISGGQGNTVYGQGAVVSGGINNLAMGETSSIPGGFQVEVTGNYAFATGWGTTAPAMGQMTMGLHNQPKGSENATTWVATDPLFVIGNGLDAISQSTALMVLKNGNVGIGTMSPTAKLVVNKGLPNATPGLMVTTTNTGANTYAQFTVNSTVIGSISSASGTNVAYNTTSDVRLKSGFAPVASPLKTLNEIEVASFYYLNDPLRTRMDGFKAQQLYKVLPYAVTKPETDSADDGSLNPWQADYSKVVPLITAALQEMYQKVLGIEARQENQDQEVVRLKASDEAKAREIASLKARLEESERDRAEMERRLERVEKLLLVK